MTDPVIRDLNEYLNRLDREEAEEEYGDPCERCDSEYPCTFCRFKKR